MNENSQKRPKRASSRIYRLGLILAALVAIALLAITSALKNFGGYVDELTTGNHNRNFTKTKIRNFQDRPSLPTTAKKPKTAPNAPQQPENTITTERSNTKNTPKQPIPTLPPPPPANSIEIEFRGLLMKGKNEAKFMIRLYPAEGPPENRILKLGDSIIEPWTIRELNQKRQTLTIGNGERLLVLNHGKRTTIDL